MTEYSSYNTQYNLGLYKHPDSVFLHAVPDNDNSLQYVEKEDRYLPEHVVAAEDLTETVKVRVVLVRGNRIASCGLNQPFSWSCTFMQAWWMIFGLCCWCCMSPRKLPWYGSPLQDCR